MSTCILKIEQVLNILFLHYLYYGLKLPKIRPFLVIDYHLSGDTDHLSLATLLT